MLERLGMQQRCTLFGYVANLLRIQTVPLPDIGDISIDSSGLLPSMQLHCAAYLQAGSAYRTGNGHPRRTSAVTEAEATTRIS